MFGWRRKKRKRWKARYDPGWYSTAELQAFLQSELDLVSYRARPVYEHVAQVARLESEIARRTNEISKL
jgi:hypothetical protein